MTEAPSLLKDEALPLSGSASIPKNPATRREFVWQHEFGNTNIQQVHQTLTLINRRFEISGSIAPRPRRFTQLRGTDVLNNVVSCGCQNYTREEILFSLRISDYNVFTFDIPLPGEKCNMCGRCSSICDTGSPSAGALPYDDKP
jgi:hypothetical protein